MYYKMDNNSYEINKIKIISLQLSKEDSKDDGYYGKLPTIKQIFYVNGKSIIDIFGEKYIKGIYHNGQLPEFYYNPVNYISTGQFNDKELKSGLISEERLLEIYYKLNSSYINYNEIKNNNVIYFSNYTRKKRKGGN